MTRMMDILAAYKTGDYSARDAIQALMARGMSRTQAQTAVMQA